MIELITIVGAHCFDLGKIKFSLSLISSALYWIENYHIDGIREWMQYLTCSIWTGSPWMPNKDGEIVTWEGCGFLQKLNREIKKRYPDVMMVGRINCSNANHPTD